LPQILLSLVLADAPAVNAWIAGGALTDQMLTAAGATIVCWLGTMNISPSTLGVINLGLAFSRTQCVTLFDLMHTVSDLACREILLRACDLHQLNVGAALRQNVLANPSHTVHVIDPGMPASIQARTPTTLSAVSLSYN
jgi:hypothetical protein